MRGPLEREVRESLVLLAVVAVAILACLVVAAAIRG